MILETMQQRRGQRPPWFGLLLLWMICSVFSAPFAGAIDTLPRSLRVEDFKHATLHDGSENEREAQRCFAVVEDEDASEDEALQVRLSVPLVRAGSFAVLRTPPLDEPLPTGTYRVTVRMKALGMLHTLGSAVTISVGGQEREVWMNEFDDEGVYQEFSLLFESRPADIITRRDIFTWSSPGGPGSLVAQDALPGIYERLARNDWPWEERFSYWIVERVVAPQLKLTPEAIPNYAGILREAVKNAGPDGIQFDDQTDEPAFTQALVDKINSHGAHRPNGAVALYFPQNVTGGTKGLRGPATPHPTLRSITIDWVKLEKVVEPDHLVMRQVACRYPWRRPGEQQRLNLWLHNRSGSEQTDSVRLLLRSGLRHEETLWEEQVTISDGAYRRIQVPWEIPAEQPTWGQTVIAQVLRDGKVLSEERTWFALHRFSNAVMIPAAPNTRRFLHPYASAAPRTQNHMQLFGANGTIYDSAGVVPDEDVFFEPYAVGNGTFMMSIPTLGSITRGLSNAGIAPFFYLESNGSAERALEIFWDHPDWVATMPANMDAFVLERRRTIDEWLAWWREGRTGEAPAIARAGGAYSGQLINMNGLIEENVTRVIEGCLKLCEHTDYTGIRWDGFPFCAYNGKALGGNWGKTQEELVDITVANLRRFRAAMREVHPNFELRANYGLDFMDNPEDPIDFDKAHELLAEGPPSSGAAGAARKEFLSNHGSFMEEWWMSYGGFGHYANNCLNYLRLTRFINSAVKKAGGHNAHMLWYYDGLSQYTPDEIYQQVFSFLGGAHLDAAFGPIPDSIHEMGVYAIRFSDFFWNPNLRPIRDLPDKVDVATDSYLWVHEAGFERETADGGFLQIIPVINPPVTELWLENRFGMLPEPLRNPFGMTVQLPEGYSRVRGVYLLDNKPYPHVRELEFTTSGGEVAFEIPELIIFKVVALEYAK